MFVPTHIYYEPTVEKYTLGQQLLQRYSALQVPMHEIESHNSIPELQARPNQDFARMKQFLILGVRKTHRYTPNAKTSDFLVPYTSSGCSASCLYCYLVCNYNKCSYLRLFVNREEMLKKLIKASHKSPEPLTYEIGSNSDLVLENTITGNLEWTIEAFGREGRGFITLPTKFHMIENLLPLQHNGRTIVRMSVNPPEIIKRIELGTSKLEDRIAAMNTLAQSGYRVGLLLAPVILLENWQQLYSRLLEQLAEELLPVAKQQINVEIILMTYSYVHKMINAEAFPGLPSLFDPEQMTGRGRGKYCYRTEARAEAEAFLRMAMEKYLPECPIAYIS